MPDSTDVLKISNEPSEELPNKNMGLIQLFRKNHEYQMYGLCGPALIKVVLKTAKDYQRRLGVISEHETASMVIPDQRVIASEIFSGPIDQEFWLKAKQYVLPKDYEFYKTSGTKSYCLPEDMARFLGNGAIFMENLEIDDIKKIVGIEKKPVAVLWNEEIPDRQGTPEGGHWSLAVGYNPSTDTFTMIDTSRAERFYDARGNVVPNIPDKKETRWTIKPKYNIDANYLAKNLHDKAIIDGEEREYNGVIIVLDLAKINLRSYIAM
ncbi:hypothetical protein A2803_05790 [Candidatus Woesebacteria bacterium RIFCSPHIGHO2_01_FULL_44_21]|uniref:Uncharacterized protein n=1 Tax=Candidatus Woesebacteria bacterium RIFCSPHIGHO2_01_FULL_44_21 TaxID=1802503 RepID=A0A1F7Z154_9BACT|nr:MAG: hypothetical protein A2803_05790 [Candidatus Woesebacteria bacterium RIFCSPHIGHO2_01_FULL_44_21]OGM71096.1 MAG: hypothetical protein A2897_02635 [Candidatus Woesebacteria bacterium RIFCSPLOWO2_01_FULL_44_24b]